MFLKSFLFSKFGILHPWCVPFLLTNILMNTRFFLLAMLSLAQAQMLLSEIQNSLKLALTFQTKRCLKYIKKESNYLTKVSEFSSQYFPR